MTKRRLSTAALVGLTVLAITARTHAILGLGDIVFDPTSFAKLTEQLLQMERQYEQLFRSYQMLRSQYDHFVFMARRNPVDMAVRYGTPLAAWPPSSASNTYGTTGNWIAALNTGSSVSQRYVDSTERLNMYSNQLATLSSAHAVGARSAYGSVELADAANIDTLQTIGTLRANAPDQESALLRLRNDTYSSSPEMNTEIAVLNKINAAGVASVQTSRDTNQLLVALAEQQLIAAKSARDAQARAINQHIQFVAEARSASSAISANASSAMRSWRLR